MNEVTIRVAKEFSRFPTGRFNDDGEFTGQRFREKFLVPNLRNPSVSKVIVDLDGVLMQGSSFFEEAFGGLIREEGFTQDDLKRKLIISYRLESVPHQIWSYIKSAKPKK